MGFWDDINPARLFSTAAADLTSGRTGRRLAGTFGGGGNPNDPKSQEQTSTGLYDPKFDIYNGGTMPTSQEDQRKYGTFLNVGTKQIWMPNKKPVELPAPPNPETDPATRQAMDEAANVERQRSNRGRASTILTGGLGVTDAAPTARRTLLGS